MSQTQLDLDGTQRESHAQVHALAKVAASLPGQTIAIWPVNCAPEEVRLIARQIQPEEPDPLFVEVTDVEYVPAGLDWRPRFTYLREGAWVRSQAETGVLALAREIRVECGRFRFLYLLPTDVARHRNRVARTARAFHR